MSKNLKELIGKLAAVWKNVLPKAKTVWSGYGYYISLVCLLTIFGITAYMYRNRDIHDSPSNTVSPGSEYAAAISVLDPTYDPLPSTTPYSPSFESPVSGEIISAFSPGELIWYDTLGQWMVHNGIDIKTDAGTVVTASESGIISAVYEDAMFGATIEISHDDCWVTRYCSLETLKLVTVGAEVAKGDIISSVGTSALSETNSGPHLHFELLKDGKHVEPVFE